MTRNLEAACPYYEPMQDRDNCNWVAEWKSAKSKSEVLFWRVLERQYLKPRVNPLMKPLKDEQASFWDEQLGDDAELWQFVDKSFSNLVVQRQSRWIVGGLSYHLDFLVGVQDGGRAEFYAVELEGRAFHDTKERAHRDRSRERALVGAGFRIVRFSGAEVYADPDECVRELIEIVSPQKGDKLSPAPARDRCERCGCDV